MCYFKVNNQTKDIRGNNFIGKGFGILQRKVGNVHEKYNFKDLIWIERTALKHKDFIEIRNILLIRKRREVN